jgi:hypothetical protein
MAAAAAIEAVSDDSALAPTARSLRAFMAARGRQAEAHRDRATEHLDAGGPGRS